MSTDIHRQAFTPKSENPERGSKPNTPSIAEGVDDSSSVSSSSSRGSRGGSRRRKRATPSHSPPMPVTAVIRVIDVDDFEDPEEGSPEETVRLTVPLKELAPLPTEKITDLVQQAIEEVGPLSQSVKPLNPEVKAEIQLNSQVAAGIGLKLPVYTEEWDHFYGNLSEDTTPVPEDKGYYYSSASGLCVKEILPFLRAPASLLANSKEFFWEHSSLVGKSPLRAVKAPSRKLLTKNAALAVHAECTLRAFTQLDPENPDRKHYFRNLKIIRFYLATWDGLMLAYQMIRTVSTQAHKQDVCLTWRVNSDLKRQIERFRIKLLREPYNSAKQLKELAGHARSWFFGGPKPNRFPLLRSIPSKYYCLIFSYLGRALPPQANSDVKSGYLKLVERLTSVPPPEVPAWKPFIRAYLDRYRPKEISTISYPTDSSAGAVFGYTRKSGGFAKATQDLVGLGLALMKAEPREEDVVYLPEGGMIDLHALVYRVMGDSDIFMTSNRRGVFTENHSILLFNKYSLTELNILAKIQSIFVKALSRAVEWTFERFDKIPFVALGAPEAGLKTRYPTISPCAVLHVSQVLRRAADSHLLMDPRTRESLGGKEEIRLDHLPGPWYSQDLTAATDLHPFWLTRPFYEEVVTRHPPLQPFAKHLPKLFGPRKLISPEAYQRFKADEEISLPVNPYLDLLTLDWAKVEEHVTQDLSYYYNTVDVDEVAPVWDDEEREVVPFFDTDTPAVDTAREHVLEWTEWWNRTNELDGITTSTGDPMGEAASFPLLPLVTTFAAERAGLPKHGNTGDDSRIPLGQKGKPSVLRESREDRSSKMNDLLSTLPTNWRNWKAMDRLTVHELSLSELGAVLSRGDPKEGKPNKIFLHKTYSLYKEIPLRGDKRLPFIPIKLLSGPPGGSKGSISWFNQPTAVRQHCVDFQVNIPHRLWRKLPYWNETLAAFSYGIPVREAVTLGGVNHPVFPHTAGTNPRNTQRWLSALSSLTLVDWATGTGLSPLPSATAQAVRTSSKEWLREIVREEKIFLDAGLTQERKLSRLGFDPQLRGPLPTLKESAEEATRFASSYLLYSVGPSEFLHTPSIMTVAHKFQRHTRRGKLYLHARKRDGVLTPLTYDGTMKDIIQKTNVFMKDPDVHIPSRHAARGYGLLEGKFDPNRKPWRWDWLERGTSDPQFINMFAEAVVGAVNPSAV